MAEHIICQDEASPAIDDLLRDWHKEGEDLDLFIKLLTENAEVETFGESSMEPTAEIDACEAVALLVQAKILGEELRTDYIMDERPQDDFDDNEIETWSAILMAIMFASDELVGKILDKIPMELKLGAIPVLNPAIQNTAKKLFVN